MQTQHGWIGGCLGWELSQLVAAIRVSETPIQRFELRFFEWLCLPTTLVPDDNPIFLDVINREQDVCARCSKASLFWEVTKPLTKLVPASMR
jgi:hypothetical protein